MQNNIYDHCNQHKRTTSVTGVNHIPQAAASTTVPPIGRFKMRRRRAKSTYEASSAQSSQTAAG